MTARHARVRLRPRGAVLLGTGALAVATGELAAVAVLVAIGAAALVAVGLALAVTGPIARRTRGSVVPQLLGLAPQVEPGTEVRLAVGIAPVDLPARTPATATQAGAAVPTRVAVTSAWVGTSGAGPSAAPVEVDDPSGRWLVRRRHDVVAAAPSGRTRRLRILPGEPAGRACTVPVPARGILEVGPLRVWQADLLGLAEAVVGEAGPWHAAAVAEAGTPHRTVSPGPRPASAAPGAATPRSRATATGGGELLELQPLRGGDATRRRAGDRPAPGARPDSALDATGAWAPMAGRLHWPSTLRTGVPMVRRFAEPSARHAAIHVDLRAGVHAGGSVDDVLAMAGDLAMAELVRGHRVRLTGIGQPDLRVEPGPTANRRLQTWLALADCVPTASAAVPGRAAGTVVTTTVGARAWMASGADLIVVGSEPARPRQTGARPPELSEAGRPGPRR